MIIATWGVDSTFAGNEFDGVWVTTDIKTSGPCLGGPYEYEITIENGEMSGGFERKYDGEFRVKGTVSPDGSYQLKTKGLDRVGVSAS